MIVGVIGSGTMGMGIAQVAAVHGYDVVLNDVAGELLARAQRAIEQDLQRSVEKGKLQKEQAELALSRIQTTTDLEAMRSANIIVEAIIERLEVKHRLFADLDVVCSRDCILATNTSSLSITELGAVTRQPDRFVGVHFFNPVSRMKLVEIIRGHRTSEETIERAISFARGMGKESVLAKDTPGFIVNRVARNYYGESFRIIDEGIASLEQVDRIMRAGGFPMGPFELMDLIGIDVNLAVTESIYEQYSYEPRFAPHLIQKKMAQARLLGRKTKRGFYDYSA